MAKAEGVVYYEDVHAADATATSDPPATASASAVTRASTSIVKQAGSAVKRQRTLMDMFSGSQEDKDSDAANKRLRLSASSPSLPQKASASNTSVSLKGAALPKLNSIPFSPSAFQNSLTDEQRKLLKLELEVMHKSWLKVLCDEIKKPYFLTLKKFLWDEGLKAADDTPPSIKIYPHPKNIYAWSNTPLGRVKVVIVGQDPYHGPGQAHGLCFSVPKGVAIPPSLKNIYAELKAEYPEFEPPKHGNLTAWASNGVLMLNTCLTVRAGLAGSHSNKGWETFTDKVVDVVDKYGGANLPSRAHDQTGSDNSGVGRGVVFLAWGGWAAKRVAKLNKTKHLILTSAHPSPLSAHRGFLGNGHFKAANNWLERKYGPEGQVDWCRL